MKVKKFYWMVWLKSKTDPLLDLEGQVISTSRKTAGTSLKLDRLRLLTIKYSESYSDYFFPDLHIKWSENLPFLCTYVSITPPGNFQY